MKWMAAVLLLVAVGCVREPPPLPEGYVSPPEPTTTRLGPAVTGALWEDMFDRPDTEQGLGDGYEMLQRLYEPRIPATDGFIRDGAYTYGGDKQVVYAVRRFGAEVRGVSAAGVWSQVRAGERDTVIALVISGNDKLITDMLHLVADRSSWALTIRRNGGEFTPVANGAFSPQLQIGENYRFALDATETTATVTVPNRRVTVAVDVRGVLGPFVFWELFLKPDQFPASTVFEFDAVGATTA